MRGKSVVPKSGCGHRPIDATIQAIKASSAIARSRTMLWAAAAGLVLAGCVSVLPDAGPAPEIYRLSSASAPVTRASAAPDSAGREGVTVMVSEPVAPRALSTDRVAVVMNGDHLSYAAGARWNERAPRVVQERILSAFEADPRVAAAVRPEDAVTSRYELRLDLLRFDAVYDNGPTAAPNVFVEMRAKLIDRATRQLLDTTRLTTTQRAEQNRMGAIIDAFDGAMDEVGARLVAWTLESEGRAAAGSQASASAASSSR
jgi:cholesterol transport system auxiliary component